MFTVYNATQTETAFRAAQVGFDSDLPGAVVVYSWPSRARALAYAYDLDSAMFARDGLASVLLQVSAAGAERVVLVAHSMGGALTMETLRQLDIEKPGWAARALGGVILISPDLDVDLFRSQMLRLQDVPQPFVIFVSNRDIILELSARIRGAAERQRLGNIENVDKIRDLPVHIVDTTAFSDDAGSAHFIPATSPAILTLLSRASSVNDMFGPSDLALSTILAGRAPDQSGLQRVVLDPDRIGVR